MTRSKSLALSLAFTLGAAASAWGQSVISAHSGTIHYTEGQVSLDGNAVQPKFGEFPEVKSGQVLSTQDGRAEILLTPGVFLRLAENSSFKMVSNQLSNTRLEVQSGEAMIEVGELLPDNAIAVVFHQGDISIARRGLYRFDSDPAKLRVYDGEASVVSPSTDPTIVRKGHELIFGEAKLEARTFDAKETDEFYRWSARRDEYVAEANITSAKSVRDNNGGMGYAGGSCMGSGMGISSNVGAYSGTGISSNVGTYTGTGGLSNGTTFSNVAMNSGLGLTPGAGVNPAGVSPGVGMNPGMGSWAFNPWFGMFTYVPCSGTYFSPFGYGYFSPYAVGYLYGPYSPYAYGNGYTGGRTGIANLGGIGRTGLTTAAASPATSGSIGRAAGTTGGLGNGGSNSSRGGGGGGFSGGSGGGGSGGGLSSGGGASHGGGGGGKH